MRAPYSHPERVPAAAAARLQKNFADLLAALNTAIESGKPGDPSLTRLQRAVTLLQQEERDLLRDMDAFHTGAREPLLTRAADLRLLARRMDGYAADVAEVLQKRQLLVLTAWQIAAAASGSEAAGL